MSMMPPNRMAPFVPNAPVPANVQPRTPFKLSQLPGMMWRGLQDAQADWRKNKEMEMRLREGMLARILGQPQVDPMAQQKAGLNPAQFQLAAPAPIQRSSYLQPAPAAPSYAMAPPTPLNPIRGPGSVLPSGNGDMAGREFFTPMY
jgi:hypothetical protein